jgi:hypothetical protein
MAPKNATRSLVRVDTNGFSAPREDADGAEAEDDRRQVDD